MTETPFEQFTALVQVDQKINNLTQSIQALHNKNKENFKAIELHESTVEKLKQKLTDMRKEVDAKELEMKELDQQEMQKKARLDHVSNQKEYQSIKSEIEQLKKAQHDLEEQLIIVWNQLDTQKKEYEQVFTKFQQQQAELQGAIDQNNNKISGTQKEIDILMQERIQKEISIPAEWLDKYKIMRAKITNPVVPVIDDSCSACFYKVSAQDMQSLKRRKLVSCKDCFRLLYFPETMQPESSESSI